MPQFIDRRLNPRDKSLGNRMRFLKRTRARIKEAVDKAVRERTIGDAAKGGSVSIPTDGINEPMFHDAESGGDRNRVLPGNKEFVSGDRLDKPKGGQGGRGRQGAQDGDGEDAFTFALSEEEFLDLLFEDLELPDLIKASLKDAKLAEPRRAGYSADGLIPNLNVLRTMRQSLSRRLALRRPSRAEIERLERRLEEIAKLPETEALQEEEARLIAELKRAKYLQRAIPFIDPIDVRYNRFTRVIVPRAKAVMFCLMDVSASMGEREKDLAKRFFILLHLFLKRKYERVDVVFIRHTHEAKEVDEHEFFYGRETGGTVVSTALEAMIEVRDKRYATAEWNVYCAEASDGDNSGGDTERCVELLNEAILPSTQYFAYIEIADRDISSHWSGGDAKELWRGYSELAESAPNFAMRKVANPADIYPVFRELFARQREKGTP
ncbi:MAG: YeaH/YhbH family protein [Pseudomonadota bacterium]|nr:YeaH/YhbH family protein [Pseudomonadota bacterium]